MSKAKGNTENITRQNILAVAEALFAEKGFYGATIRDIASQLDIANASLLYYFPTKGRLYAAVLEKITLSLEQLFDTFLTPESGVDERAQVRHLVGAYVDWAVEHPHYCKIVLREMLDNAQRVQEVRYWYISRLTNRIDHFLQTGQTKGHFRQLESDTVLLFLVGSVNYSMAALPALSELHQVEQAKIVAGIRKNAIELFEKGILTPTALLHIESADQSG
jgi:AcrR family transcriptional regulator